MRIDLHVHTMESDGAFSVQAIIELALDNGVGILAITDHESTQGVAEAERLSEEAGLTVIPGLEFLTYYQEQEVHLLGYYRSVEHPELQSRLKELRERRTALAYDMVKRLQADGIPLTWPAVEKEASAEGAVSKGHIIRAMHHGNIINPSFGWREAGAFFQPGGAAYLPFFEHRFEDAVDLIYATGGVPVLAHPGILRNREIVPRLLRYRPMGLEVYYGYWEQRQALIEHYGALAKERALFATGGSDFHGPFSPFKIGQLDIPLSGVSALREYLEERGHTSS
ncbi:MAG: PHP domain-containing protein [Desulfitobacteriaceae bacterium]|nr:PHP domain-containing protein [Desulfitobacteriaceae bacterium]MDI6880610.1 PHP domain-containing protein [Desulfitobacteriaceae bacterium]MDI6915111.1 PHP domain-containing protein [Desulfitobacteriaceae bacterium]